VGGFRKEVARTLERILKGYVPRLLILHVLVQKIRVFPPTVSCSSLFFMYWSQKIVFFHQPFRVLPYSSCTGPQKFVIFSTNRFVFFLILHALVPKMRVFLHQSFRVLPTTRRYAQIFEHLLGVMLTMQRKSTADLQQENGTMRAELVYLRDENKRLVEKNEFLDQYMKNKEKVLQIKVRETEQLEVTLSP
jgi:hypothetical protein